MSAARLAKLSRASLAGAVLLIAAGLLLSVTQARAETVKGRGILHFTKWETTEVGDMSGHVLSVGEWKGLIFFENGEVSTMSGAGTSDSPKGKNTFTSVEYEVFTFEDGSTQFIKWQGTFTRATKGKPGSVKGTFTYIGGSGRFEGIQGSGSWSGKSFPGFGGYYDFTGTYTLPEK